MNRTVVLKSLGTIALLIGAMMVFSLPWAIPAFSGAEHFEQRGFLALLASIGCCLLVAIVLFWLGRGPAGSIFRKEAMAIVGLSWLLATLLGALPYAFSGTPRAAGVPMNPADWLFEAQSGFSTTGASVLTDLDLVDRCILFWRSSTHFLGGLGIIVLFVALLGQGSAGKALMRTEMPGPTKEGAMARMQHTAWWFTGIYVGLNVALTVLLMGGGLSLFDALCHAFGTLATGGFSTHNESVGYFARHPQQYHAVWIETTMIIFMILAGTNFTLLYYLLVRKPQRLWHDIEWRTYLSILLLGTAILVATALSAGDFDDVLAALRYVGFQVVSIMTTTGYITHDFDGWNHFARGTLFLLMFVGGCAGSTGGGLKVIRHVVLFKVLSLEIEQVYRPSVVRPLRIAGQVVDDPDMRKNVPVYFGIVLVIFVMSWIFIVGMEPDATWNQRAAAASHAGDTVASRQHNLMNKLIDSASAVAATLNNIGPGLGTIGATQNYAHFSWYTKLLLTFLMMLGRLELFPVLVLLLPAFWRSR
jgi:trk system potassium uptake protein TrkH